MKNPPKKYRICFGNAALAYATVQAESIEQVRQFACDIPVEDLFFDVSQELLQVMEIKEDIDPFDKPFYQLEIKPRWKPHDID